MSRAAWVALGPSAVGILACYGEVRREGLAADGGTGDDAKAAPQGPTGDAGDGSVNADIAVPCGTFTCVWPKDVCVHTTVKDYMHPCWAQPPDAPVVTHEYRCDSWPSRPPCSSDYCGCYADAGLVATCDPGVTVHDERIITGCGGCYGAPPARLERLPALQRTVA